MVAVRVPFAVCCSNMVLRYMIQMLKQKDAGYSNGRGDILIFNDTTKELLYDIAGHVEKGAFSTFKILFT